MARPCLKAVTLLDGIVGGAFEPQRMGAFGGELPVGSVMGGKAEKSWEGHAGRKWRAMRELGGVLWCAGGGDGAAADRARD